MEDSKINIEEIKEKFSTIQRINTSLKEEKIRTESTLKTLEDDYNKKLQELLEKTGTDSFDDAVESISSRKRKLDEDMESLNKELSSYLDTYGEEENA